MWIAVGTAMVALQSVSSQSLYDSPGALAAYRESVGSNAATIALAGPQGTAQVPRNRATVMLTIDVSLSMRATDVAPTRLAAMQSAASRFLDRVPRRVKVGAVAFNGRTAVLAALTAATMTVFVLHLKRPAATDAAASDAELAASAR